MRNQRDIMNRIRNVHRKRKENIAIKRNSTHDTIIEKKLYIERKTVQ